mmetsp:Transcript_39107/g.99073  ORF Transcript_39107/g.99073 Transcript_39107/m.99073 type:complete len:630 (-) Transcript_39107:668-2557(-)
MGAPADHSDARAVEGRLQGRPSWPSRASFLLAAIGSAVGLGNIWRFPYLCYRHGGGIFLIPYLLCLVVIGFPLLLLELSLGMKFRAGDVEAFGGIHRRLRGVGISSVISGFVIVAYYSNIISWSCVYFVSSFISPLPWTAEAQGMPAECAIENALAPEENFLYNRVMHLASEEQLENAQSEIIAGWVYGGLVIIFVVAYFSIWKGVQSAGRVVYFTATAPVLILIILFGYNISLPGAGDGVRAYMGTWDTSALNNPSIWTDAAGQIFFTLGVSMGIMTAYGSYVSPKSDLVMDHAIITGTNSLISIFSGFVVYSVLGNVVHEHLQQCPELADSEDPVAKVYGSASISLAFVVYPRGLSNFPAGVSNFMGVLFFFTLMNLGIDSAFSMVEGVTTVITDTPRFRHIRRESVALVTCGLAFLASTLFATDLGLYLLDSVDHYINNYGLQLVGIMECTSVGWIYGHSDCVARVGRKATIAYTTAFFSGSILAVLLAGAMVNVYPPNYLGLAVGIPVGFVVFLIGAAASFALREDKSKGFGQFVCDVSFCGTEILRATINQNARVVPLCRFWDFMVKYMCPPILLGLLIVGIIADTQTDGYAGYPGWLQAVSTLLLLAIMAAFVGMHCPLSYGM